MSDKKKKAYGSGRFPLGGFFCACMGTVALALLVILIMKTDYEAERLAVIILAAYVGLMIISCAVYIIVGALTRRNSTKLAMSVTQGLSLQFLQKLSKPVIICDDKGKITWYNQYLKKICAGDGLLYNKYLDTICDATIERIVKSDEKTGAEVRFSSAETADAGAKDIYNAFGYEIKIENKTYYVSIFDNVTKLKDTEKRLSDEDTILAYAMIDNLDELLQYVQDLYANVSAEVFASCFTSS